MCDCWWSKATKGKWHSLFCPNAPNVCGHGRPLPHLDHSFDRCVPLKVKIERD